MMPGGPVSRPERLKAIAGGAAGNFIEWFDWFLFVSFSLYFAPVFFPPGDRTIQLMQSATVLAIGFVVRPLGAWGFGLLADRRGRRNALTLSVALMCCGSLLIALTPGYAEIGVAAPALLLVARLAQGFSVGGEYGASATYISEMAGQRHRGLWSSFQCVTLVLGQLAALALLMVLQALLSDLEMAAWGWRIAFLIGAALSFAVFFLRRTLHETEAFSEQNKNSRRKASALQLVREHRRATLLVFWLTAAGSIGFYIFIGYSQKFLTISAGFPPATASAITAAALIVFLIAQPMFGFLSDHIGRVRTLAASFAAVTLLAWPALRALSMTSSPLQAWAILSLLLIAFSGYSAIGAVVKAELFPTDVRALGVGLPYAVANAAFGGFAELVALAMRVAGREWLFFATVTAAMAVGFIVALRIPETRHHDLAKIC